MIQVDLNKCTGCRSCETACSFFRTGKVSRHLSRIKVMHIYETGIDGPVVCIQCDERYCMSCPESALKSGDLDQVIASPTICTRCGACVTKCPIGAIELFNDIIYVCDLCGGRPKCIEACTEGAIQFRPNPPKGRSLSTIKTQTKGMNPSEKRRLYIEQLGAKVREKWRKVAP
ncbi:MAG: 4Fe-4S dicluster domain-containing protein [Candidatus Thorarchaeota archaeon]